MAKKDQQNIRQSFTMFSVSQPGYYFPEVEDAISEYKTTISDLSECLSKKDNTIAGLENEIIRLREELSQLHIQLNSIDVNDYSYDEAVDIIADFSDNIACGVPKATRENRDKPKNIIG